MNPPWSSGLPLRISREGSRVRISVLPTKNAANTAAAGGRAVELPADGEGAPTVEEPQILEHLIHSRLMPFVMENNIISCNQYGFMPGRSTSHAIFELTKYLFDNTNKGNICGSVFIDISKAFDSVYHPRLLLKLERLGLGQIYIKWFRSYLLRSQSVFFN